MFLKWEALIRAAIEFRHALHRQPELTWQEVHTAEKIRNELDQAGIYWQAFAKTGTVARLAAQAKGRHIALRGDMDALPLVEASGVKWSSEVQGRMHACGHDGHTASLMATAWWLKCNEGSLEGPVSLIFQPAEEGGHGAKRMMDEGALEGVDVIYGWHNWPAIPFGKALCPDGPIMAANGTFRLTISGVGGHSGQPEVCSDPVLAAAALTLNLQQIISRRLPPQVSAVLSVTSIDARSNETTIPAQAVLSGSVRIENLEIRDRINNLIQEIATATAQSYGVDVVNEFFPRYGATINHVTEAGQFRAALTEELGENWQASTCPSPIMASEDFSDYLEKIPGAFALLGSDDGGSEHQQPCHSSYYDFNDRLIPLVVKLYSRLTGSPVPE